MVDQFKYLEYWGKHVDQVAEQAEVLQQRLEAIEIRRAHIQNDERS